MSWANGFPTPPGPACPWPSWLVNALGPDLLHTVVAVACPAGVQPPAGDATMGQMARLGRLEHLNLNGAGIGDGGLAHLAGLSHLFDLQLDGLAITDVGLVHLTKLDRLGWLTLNRTEVTNDGVKAARWARSDWQISQIVD